MFVRADHTGVSVRDMEKAIAFYRDVIGMEKAFDREFEAPVDRLTGLSGARVRIVHMKLGFIVEDFWGTYQHLLDHGVRFVGEPVEIRPGVFVAYFHGAEDEVCEIREITAQAGG